MDRGFGDAVLLDVAGDGGVGTRDHGARRHFYLRRFLRDGGRYGEAALGALLPPGFEPHPASPMAEASNAIATPVIAVVRRMKKLLPNQVAGGTAFGRKHSPLWSD